MKAGYTLLEIMVSCAVMAVMLAIAVPATSKISGYSARTKSISNLRQIGVAARLYANDHNQQLPGQPLTDPQGATAPDQWPTLFCAYLTPSNPAVFVDPTNDAAKRLPNADILSNSINNTGYIYNGFDDLAADNRPPASVLLNRLATQTDVVLLAQKKSGAKPFFISPIFQPITNLLDVLDPGAFDGGAHYLFVDGSVRYVKWGEYSNNFWVADKTISLPLPPLPPFFNGGPGGGHPPGAPQALATIW